MILKLLLLAILIVMILFIIDVFAPDYVIRTGEVINIQRRTENPSKVLNNTFEDYSKVTYSYYFVVKDVNSLEISEINCSLYYYINQPKRINYKQYTTPIFKIRYTEIL